jgi:NADH-quinone oxidoreductase subunit E
MLTAYQKAAVDAAAANAPSRMAAAPEALRAIQEKTGWLSDQTVLDVARYLGVSASSLDGVATFYNRLYRSPVGAHVILVCDGVSCWIMEQKALLRHLFDLLGVGKFGETSADGLFTVLPVACLGACDHAPAMMVDTDLYGDLSPEKIDRIIDGCRNGRQ